MLTVCKLVISCLIFAKLAYSSSNNPCEDWDDDRLGFNYFEQALEEIETGSDSARGPNDSIRMYTGTYEVPINPQCNGVAHSFHWGWNSQPTTLQSEGPRYQPNKRQRVEPLNGDRVPEDVLIPGGDDHMVVENIIHESIEVGEQPLFQNHDIPRVLRYMISNEIPPVQVYKRETTKLGDGREESFGFQEADYVKRLSMLKPDAKCAEFCKGIIQIAEVLAQYNVFFHVDDKMLRNALVATRAMLSQIYGKRDARKLSMISGSGPCFFMYHDAELGGLISGFMRSFGAKGWRYTGDEFKEFLVGFLSELHAQMEAGLGDVDFGPLEKYGVKYVPRNSSGALGIHPISSEDPFLTDSVQSVHSRVNASTLVQPLDAQSTSSMTIIVENPPVASREVEQTISNSNAEPQIPVVSDRDYLEGIDKKIRGRNRNENCKWIAEIAKMLRKYGVCFTLSRVNFFKVVLATAYKIFQQIVDRRRFERLAKRIDDNDKPFENCEVYEFRSLISAFARPFNNRGARVDPSAFPEFVPKFLEMFVRHMGSTPRVIDIGPLGKYGVKYVMSASDSALESLSASSGDVDLAGGTPYVQDEFEIPSDKIAYLAGIEDLKVCHHSVTICNGIMKIVEALADCGICVLGTDSVYFTKVLAATLAILLQLYKTNGDTAKLKLIIRRRCVLVNYGKFVPSKFIIRFMRACGYVGPDPTTIHFLNFLPEFLVTLETYLKKHFDRINFKALEGYGVRKMESWRSSNQ